MKIELSFKPKNPTIIGGFPGLGLVGMIATEFLVNHLDTKEIGRIWSEELPPIVAIHNKSMIQPLQIFYNKKNNLVIVQGIAATKGTEWPVSQAIVELAQLLKAKEVLALDGVGTKRFFGKGTYVYSPIESKQKELTKKKFEVMNKGIIAGMTGAMLVKASDKVPLVCFFAETSSGLPDSKAAAFLIKDLDSYLGLKLSYAPLLKQAKEFEQKFKSMMQGQAMAQPSSTEDKHESYFG